jgi:hypothetical protein
VRSQSSKNPPVLKSGGVQCCFRTMLMLEIKGEVRPELQSESAIYSPVRWPNDLCGAQTLGNDRLVLCLTETFACIQQIFRHYERARGRANLFATPARFTVSLSSTQP